MNMLSDAMGITLIALVSGLLILGRIFWLAKKKTRPSIRADIYISIFIILFAAFILLLMGRVPWCACGEIWLWSGDVFTEHNSQHIFDPYSFTHFIHGLGFYILIWIFGRRLPFGVKLALAIGLESIWEVIENTTAIIEYYRANTVSLGYYGDSVINSVSDILAMAGGFLFAYRFKVAVSVIVFIAIELFLAFWIKDNLTLNIVMFIHPFEVIKNWQLGM